MKQIICLLFVSVFLLCACEIRGDPALAQKAEQTATGTPDDADASPDADVLSEANPGRLQAE